MPPYILDERRPPIDKGMPPEVAGDLNYMLFKRMLEYRRDKGERYATFNDIMGASEWCRFEIQQRHRPNASADHATGELEHDFMQACNAYLLQNGGWNEDTRRGVLGALHGSMAEFYNRYIVRYERNVFTNRPGHSDIVV